MACGSLKKVCVHSDSKSCSVSTGVYCAQCVNSAVVDPQNNRWMPSGVCIGHSGALWRLNLPLSMGMCRYTCVFLGRPFSKTTISMFERVAGRQ